MFWNVQGAPCKAFVMFLAPLSIIISRIWWLPLNPELVGIKQIEVVLTSPTELKPLASSGEFGSYRRLFSNENALNYKQFIHFKISEKNELVSWVTAVYANLIPYVRKHL